MSNKLREAIGNIYMGEINGVAVYPQSVDIDAILDAVIEALPEEKNLNVYDVKIWLRELDRGSGYDKAIREIKSILLEAKKG